MLVRNALLARKLVFTLGAGFALVLVLIGALTALALHQLAETNARLESIVNENSVKMRLANQMRDILRDRAISMLSIVVMNDHFEKDREMMRFYNYGSAYQGVRLELEALTHLPREHTVLAQIDSLTRANQPIMVRTVELAMEGYTFLAFEVLQKEAIPLQRKLVQELDAMIYIQRDMTRQAAQEARDNYDRTQWLMVVLGVGALLVAVLVAATVMRRTARLAAATERERTKFQTLFETNTDGIVILDRHGFTDCNPATLDMFHLEKPEDFLRNRPEDLGDPVQLCGTPRHELAGRHIREASENGHSRFEWIARRPDGSTFPAEITLHAMTLDKQRVIQAIMRDVSDQKQAEAALRAARDTALAATEMKSQFVANVSHEIRTPMNGILGMTQLLLGSPLNARQREYAEAISRSSDALMGVINDLLDFSKIEAGRLAMEETEFDLPALLKDVLELYTPRADAKHLALRLETGSDLPAHVIGDPLRIRQILLNLLDNALKFTEHGEVSLIVELIPDGDTRLRFTVRDTGIGMSAQVQGRIFQAFAQGDGSISRKYGGTGLGLVICRQLAELMGGALTLESVPGQGSSFRLDLPLATAAARTTQDDEQTAHVHFPGVRVLVAEDNPVNQKLLGYMLEHLGAETLLAGDGKSAFELLASHPVDLVLMDCQMPEWDGLTATRAIRTREAEQGQPRIPVLALTANAMSGYAEICHQAGMDDYLAKPLSEEALAAALARWLPNRAQPRPDDAGQRESAGKMPLPANPQFQIEKVRRLCQNDPHKIDEMLSLFITSTETLLDALAQAAEAGNAQQAARQAHQIKGAAAYLGAEEMVQLAMETETAAKEADWPRCRNALEDLQAVFISMRLEIASLANG